MEILKKTFNIEEQEGEQRGEFFGKRGCRNRSDPQRMNDQ